MLAVFFLNIKYWNIEKFGNYGIGIGLLLFGFIFPFISMIVEIQIAKYFHDAYEALDVLYTYLRFPVYWVIGFFQVLVLIIKMRTKQNRS
jgi:hypothetical protein